MCGLFNACLIPSVLQDISRKGHCHRLALWSRASIPILTLSLAQTLAVNTRC